MGLICVSLVTKARAFFWGDVNPLVSYHDVKVERQLVRERDDLESVGTS